MTEKENSCMQCPGLKTTEWDALAEAELTSMDNCKRVITCEPGEILFSQGEEGNGVSVLSRVLSACAE